MPELKNRQCEELILAALRKTEGVLADKTQFGKNSVTVTYDSMKLAIKNLESAIAEAGFTANDTPAVPAARAALPAECK